MSSVVLYQIDAFTRRPFAGNPAAVCLMDGPASPEWMQQVAAEMNLSETAFVYPLSGADSGAYSLRWFTPAVEVDLCGHATLATAQALLEEGWVKAGDTARFQSRSGWLAVTVETDRITMDFPLTDCEAHTASAALRGAMGIGDDLVDCYLCGANVMLVLENETAVADCAPDFGALAKQAYRGVIITAASERAEFDFTSRFFAPALGINEDPVTGSAHCALATYWGPRLAQNHLTAWQASSRGGALSLTISQDRCLISGQATTIFKGALYV